MKIKRIITFISIMMPGIIFSLNIDLYGNNRVLNGLINHKSEDGSDYVSQYVNGVRQGYSTESGIQYYYVNGVKHGWSYEQGNQGVVYFKRKMLFWHGKVFGTRYLSKYYSGREMENERIEEGAIGLPYDIDVSSAAYMPQEWPSPFSGYTGDDYYHPDNLLDQIKETVWVSKHTDFSEICLRLSKYNNSFVKFYVIVNGNRINNQEYYKFSRIKEAEIEIYREKNSKFQFYKKFKTKFNDNFEVKRILINLKDNIGFHINILSIYRGTQYKNVAISDMYLEF